MSAACERVRGRLAELRDGALDPLEAARDQGHLEACVGCAAERAALERLGRAVRASGRSDPAEAARAQAGRYARLASTAPVEPRAIALEISPPRRAWRLAGALATAAAAILLLGALARAGLAPKVTSARLQAVVRPSVRPSLPDLPRVLEDGLVLKGAR